MKNTCEFQKKLVSVFSGLIVSGLLTCQVFGQNQQAPPPGVPALPTFSEYIEATMQPYLPSLENMTEGELADIDRDFKQFMKWRTGMESRVHPDGTLMDYLLMKQEYANSLKSTYESAGDWHELGPYVRPGGLGNSSGTIGTGANGIGPVSWISFDPNFETTQLMFTGGWSSGLWYSEDGGDTWQNGGTDQLPPPISTADGISSHTDEDIWFITTGDGRGSKHKPGLRSSGLFRTTDRGENWEMIGAPWDFQGATEPDGWNFYNWELRKLLLNPESSNQALQLFVTGYNGVYRTNNALGNINSNPTITDDMAWERIFDYTNVPANYTIGGVTYQLSDYDSGNSNEQYINIYAYDITWGYTNNGIDTDKLIISCSPVYENVNDPLDEKQIAFVYISDDQGDSWNMINLSTPPIGYYDMKRLALRTTPASTEMLFVHGGYPGGGDGLGATNGRVCYYNLSSNSWVNNIDFSSLGTGEPVWGGKEAAFAVSPTSENEFYITKSIYLQRTVNGGSSFQTISAPGNYHVDLEDIEYSPDGSQVWLATHGGPYMYDIPSNVWYDKMSGIGNAEVLGFSTSKTNPDRMLIGTYHDGTMYASGNVEPNWIPDWKTVRGGDGQECLIDAEDFNISYVTTQGPYGTVTKNVNAWSTTSQTGTNPPSGTYQWYINIESNPFNTASIYVARTDLWRHDNRGETGTSWVNLTNVGSGSFDYGNREFESIRYSRPSGVNENLLFALALGNDGTNNVRDIFGCNAVMSSASEAQSSWFLIPQPIEPYKYWVSDVVSDPDNHNVLYMLIGNAPLNNEWPATHKVAKYTYNGDDLMTDSPTTIENEGFTIEDLTFDFPNLSAQKLIIVPGSRDFFIATDMGVFYSNEELMDENEDVWLTYGENFPYCNIDRMEVNYESNKVRVATFGRGVWENDMPCDKIETPIEITEDAIWDDFRRYRSDIDIMPGVTLTITGEVQMITNTKINVHPNAKLVINGGLVTSACGDFWKGIEVWGTTGATQSLVSGYRPQGYFELINGGIVENARTGVSNWKEDDWNAIGGVIMTKNGEFRNNKRAVQFMKHQNILPNGNPVANLSRFRNTSFKVDDDYIGDLEIDYPFAQVTLWGVDGVVFTSCEFENSSTVSSAEKRSKGIYSEDAHYIVSGSCSEILQVGQPCPEESQVPSAFNGFYRGIEAAKVADARPIVVRSTHFENNMVGIELANLDYSEIIFSKFEMGGHPHQYEANQNEFYTNHLGVYSNKTRCFVIEENTFVKDENALWPDNNGLYIFNSMQNSNNVYRNSFTDLESGGIGYQLNRNENGTIGLQFTCNNMVENKNDFIVGRQTFEQYHDISGIRTNQGNLNPDKPAMNVFSVPNGISNNYTHWTINSDAIKRYIHTAGTAPDVNEITPNSMLLVQVQTQNNCPTNYNGGVKPSKGNIIQEYNEKSTSYHSLLYTYKQLIDDGNTDAAVDEVMSTWPNAAWELRDQLMARSPNNSETVLITAAAREIMPHAMLLEVLLENPDALSSGAVINYVETKLSNPLPSYMIDILRAAREQSTMRTTMENSLSAQHEDMSRDYRFIVQHYSGDTINEFQSDSLLFWLGKMHSPTGLYNLAGKHLSIGNHTTALNILDSIPVNYKLTIDETAEWNALKSLFQLIVDAETAYRSIARLDSSEIAHLQALATDNDGGIGALRARKALCFFYDICLEEPLLTKSLSDNKNKTQVPPLNELLSDLDKIDVFPNPATDYVTFSFNFFKQDTPKHIRLYNQSGAQIQNFALGEVKEGQQLWDTRKLTPGIYLYEVYDDKRKTATGKVVIQ